MAEPVPAPSGPAARNARALQIEGLGIALLYVGAFAWIHLTAGTHALSLRLTALFFAGLVAVPVVVGLPLVLVRRALAPPGEEPGPLGAIAPFAPVALYGLQAVLVVLATIHAYRWIWQV